MRDLYFGALNILGMRYVIEDFISTSHFLKLISTVKSSCKTSRIVS